MRARQKMRQRQSGTTLLIALIFLVILTLFAVSGMNTGVINLRTANNAQMILEAEFAAQQQVEGFITTVANFTGAAGLPAVTTTNVDVNGDGNTDFVVNTRRPRCLSIKTATGYEYDLSGNAPKDTVWEITSTASDSVFGASVNLRQGIKVRLPVGTDCINP